MVLDLDVKEHRGAVDSALSAHPPPPLGSPDFSTRIRRRRQTEEAGLGSSWQQTLEFVRNPVYRKGSAACLLMRGTFLKLRLYHVINLVQIINEEFDQAHGGARSEKPRHEQFNDEDFVLAIACILHVFSDEWSEKTPQTPDFPDFPDCHRSLLDTLNITGRFMSRWARGTAPQSLSIEVFLSSPETSKLTIRSRPCVSSSFAFVSQL